MDFQKPLVLFLSVIGHVQPVKNEGLHQICFHCGYMAVIGSYWVLSTLMHLLRLQSRMIFGDISRLLEIGN